jgi:hypothetical protein
MTKEKKTAASKPIPLSLMNYEHRRKSHALSSGAQKKFLRSLKSRPVSRRGCHVGSRSDVVQHEIVASREQTRRSLQQKGAPEGQTSSRPAREIVEGNSVGNLVKE